MQIQKALVLGMARSGAAAARLLHARGCDVTICDIKTREQFQGALDGLDVPGVHWHLGEEDPRPLLEGMDALILSPGIPDTHPAVARARELGVEVMGELEYAYRESTGTLLAVTGTNGKTTTSTLLGEIFKNAGRRTWVVGNIGAPYAQAALKMRAGDVTVCEVSSFQLETVLAVPPRGGGGAQRHGGPPEPPRHHGELHSPQRAHLRQLPRGRLRGTQLRQRHYPRHGRAHARQSGVVLALRRGSLGGARARGQGSSSSTRGANAPSATPRRSTSPAPITSKTPSPPRPWRSRRGVPAPVVRHTLRAFQGVEHRLEFVRELDGVRYINDSKGTNVDSTLWAVRSMTAPTVIILGGSYKKADYHPLGRELMRGNITHAVLIGDTADAIEAALKDEGFTACVRAGYDFEKAIATARSLAAPGGNVLLSPACASFDMFTDYEARGREFKRTVKGLEPNMA